MIRPRPKKRPKQGRQRRGIGDIQSIYIPPQGPLHPIDTRMPQAGPTTGYKQQQEHKRRRKHQCSPFSQPLSARCRHVIIPSAETIPPQLQILNAPINKGIIRACSAPANSPPLPRSHVLLPVYRQHKVLGNRSSGYYFAQLSPPRLVMPRCKRRTSGVCRPSSRHGSGFSQGPPVARCGCSTVSA